MTVQLPDGEARLWFRYPAPGERLPERLPPYTLSEDVRATLVFIGRKTDDGELTIICAEAAFCVWPTQFRKETGRRIALTRCLKHLFPKNPLARWRVWMAYFLATNQRGLTNRPRWLERGMRVDPRPGDAVLLSETRL